jgi:hypothetical protein
LNVIYIIIFSNQMPLIKSMIEHDKLKAYRNNIYPVKKLFFLF